jgi:predicted lipoprotein
MKSRLVWAFALLVGLAVLFRLFPLFHVVSIQTAQKQRQSATSIPAAFAADFWKNKLLPATDHATPISELWKALAADPAAARKKFGQSPGMSSVTYFLVRGSGKVAKVDKDNVQLSLENPPPETLELSTGLIFGNALRDSTGLLNGSDFPNSQDFNDLSTELNHLVEASVIPALREKTVPGAVIHFVGCLELDEGEPPKVPRIIPVKVE